MKVKTTTPIGLCAALAAVFAATLALAQGAGTVARLKDLKGNVLVSHQSGMASGNEASRLVEHARVITTAGSEVIVAYDNGCEVRLRENQRFEIVTDKACAALIPESLFTPPQAGFASGAGFADFAIPAVGAAILIDILLDKGNQPAPPAPISPS